MTAQLAFPGMAKPRRLSHLYWDACADYWGPIMECLEAENDLGEEGITEAELVGVGDFMDISEFRARCDREGVPYTIRPWEVGL